MIKNLLFIFLSISFLHASYEIIESENLFIVKTNHTNFETNLTNLKNEINFESFVTVYEINVAKSTNEVASTLSKNGVLEKGINLGICKSSFTLQMVEENINNINYCPLGISVYQNKNKQCLRIISCLYYFWQQFLHILFQIYHHYGYLGFGQCYLDYKLCSYYKWGELLVQMVVRMEVRMVIRTVDY